MGIIGEGVRGALTSHLFITQIILGHRNGETCCRYVDSHRLTMVTVALRENCVFAYQNFMFKELYSG